MARSSFIRRLDWVNITRSIHKQQLRSRWSNPAGLFLCLWYDDSDISMTLSIITINFRTDDFTRALIRSFLASAPTDWELIIVNNDPHSELSYSLDLKHKGRISFITPGKNLGFGAACNLASKQAKGEWLLFHNPDVTFDAEAIIKLLDVGVEERRSTAICAPAIRYPDGRRQATAGRFPSMWSELVTALHLPRWFGARTISTMRLLNRRWTKVQAIDWVSGAVMLISANRFVELGRFNPDYFTYFEDIDLCKRSWLAGKRVLYVGTVEMIHDAHAATKTDRTLIGVLNHRGLHTYLSLFHGKFSRWFILCTWHTIGFLRWLTSFLMPTNNEKRRFLKSRWTDKAVPLSL